jgi:DNA-binding NtrC family response regulator
MDWRVAMGETDLLKGRKIIIVDDEPDILETLEELLDMCLIDTAPSYEEAQKLLTINSYDVAILDIMGVRGYDLLALAKGKNIPALMLTAHALSPENLVKSIKQGAHAYVPKDKIADIALYVADIIKSQNAGHKRQGQWFARLKPFFKKRFGPDWRGQDKKFWDDFDKKFTVTREELEKIL